MGRYLPPDSNPRTTPFNTVHPLYKRALVVRFELPFPTICLSCTTHLSQGVRFNAEKQQVGQYLSSTKIWSFTCKCPHCSSKFEIRTDPQRAQYVVGHGARRQMQEWDPEENGGFPVFDWEKRKVEGGEGEGDAFAKVEKQTREQSRAKQRELRVQELLDRQQQWSDPYGANGKLRDRFRKDKRKRVEQLESDLLVKERLGWAEEKVLLSTSPSEAESEKRAWKDAKGFDGARTSSRQVRQEDSSEKAGSAAQRLRATLVANTLKKKDPFLQHMHTQPQTSTPTRSSTSSSRSLSKHI